MSKTDDIWQGIFAKIAWRNRAKEQRRQDKINAALYRAKKQWRAHARKYTDPANHYLEVFDGDSTQAGEQG